MHGVQYLALIEQFRIVEFAGKGVEVVESCRARRLVGGQQKLVNLIEQMSGHRERARLLVHLEFGGQFHRLYSPFVRLYKTSTL